MPMKLNNKQESVAQMLVSRGIFACTQAVQILRQSNKNWLYAVCLNYADSSALRPKKAKSDKKEPYYFVDSKRVRMVGGKGGDGCISFLQLWCNERAGPDGGDGGNGGHIILQASEDVNNFNHIAHTLRGDEGGPGRNKDCHGRSAKHTVLKVPVGTIVRNSSGQIVGDLDRSDLMFVAARGGVGGKGNRFFLSATEQSPKVCEYGPTGEDLTYLLELRSMAHVGLIGFPNAGKSTLLNAISRAKPKVAPYAFTTLRPHIGTVQYKDHTQLAVADLPGLIPGSHKNKGLGIQFLKHAERCSVLMFVLDASCGSPWSHYEQLMHELTQFSSKLAARPQIVVANKIDLMEAEDSIQELRNKIKAPIIAISAKMGINLAQLLATMRDFHDRHQSAMQNRLD